MRGLLSPGGRRILAELRRPGTLVVLDFDGTIAPLVRDRTAATMTARTRGLLARVAAWSLRACSRDELKRKACICPSRKRGSFFCAKRVGLMIWRPSALTVS